MSQELRLIRRITLKLIPFLILLYLIAYVDRSAVGFAKLHMGADPVSYTHLTLPTSDLV